MQDEKEDPSDAAVNSKTVIITGAQIPLSELFNDSIENLLGALIIAGTSGLVSLESTLTHFVFRPLHRPRGLPVLQSQASARKPCYQGLIR